MCVGGFGSDCSGEDGVGVFDLVEGLAALVPGVDVGADRGLEVGDGGERSAADGLAGDDPEEAVTSDRRGPLWLLPLGWVRSLTQLDRDWVTSD